MMPVGTVWFSADEMKQMLIKGMIRKEETPSQFLKRVKFKLMMSENIPLEHDGTELEKKKIELKKEIISKKEQSDQLKREIDSLRIEKFKFDNGKMEEAYKVTKEQKMSETRLNNSKTKLNTLMSDYMENFGQPMKAVTAKSMKKNILQPLPKKEEKTKPDYDTNPVNLAQQYLICVECGITFSFDHKSRSSVANSKDQYLTHRFKKHAEIPLWEEEELKLQAL